MQNVNEKNMIVKWLYDKLTFLVISANGVTIRYDATN